MAVTTVPASTGLPASTGVPLASAGELPSALPSVEASVGALASGVAPESTGVTVPPSRLHFGRQNPGASTVSVETVSPIPRFAS
jgi:hypothetical protein